MWTTLRRPQTQKKREGRASPVQWGLQNLKAGIPSIQTQVGLTTGKVKVSGLGVLSCPQREGKRTQGRREATGQEAASALRSGFWASSGTHPLEGTVREQQLLGDSAGAATRRS